MSPHTAVRSLTSLPELTPHLGEFLCGGSNPYGCLWLPGTLWFDPKPSEKESLLFHSHSCPIFILCCTPGSLLLISKHANIFVPTTHRPSPLPWMFSPFDLSVSTYQVPHPWNLFAFGYSSLLTSSEQKFIELEDSLWIRNNFVHVLFLLWADYKHLKKRHCVLLMFLFLTIILQISWHAVRVH